MHDDWVTHRAPQTTPQPSAHTKRRASHSSPPLRYREPTKGRASTPYTSSGLRPLLVPVRSPIPIHTLFHPPRSFPFRATLARVEQPLCPQHAHHRQQRHQPGNHIEVAEPGHIPPTLTATLTLTLTLTPTSNLTL